MRIEGETMLAGALYDPLDADLVAGEPARDPPDAAGIPDGSSEGHRANA